MPRVSRRAVVVAVVAAIALTIALLPSREQAFLDTVARLRAEGFAVTQDELYANPAPEADAAGAELRAAYEALGAWGAEGPIDDLAKVQGLPWVRKLTGPWDVDAAEPWQRTASPERLEALVAWLDEARPYYARIGAAVAHPEIRLPLKRDADGFPTGPDIAFVQRLQKLLSARALAARRPEDRIDAARDQIRLARRVRANNLIGTMVSRAGEAMAIGALRDGVESGTLSADAVRTALRGELVPRPADERSTMARGEIAWIAETCGMAIQGKWPSWLPRPSVGERMLGFAKRVFGRGRDDDELTHESASRMLEFWASLARGSRPWPRPGDPPDTDPAVQTQSRDAAVHVGVRMRSQDAAIALAPVALAVKSHRESSGRWPASLDDVRDQLGGTVPPDPSTGAPFLYEVGDDVVRIAALGRSPQDTILSGAERRERSLVWEFPR